MSRRVPLWANEAHGTRTYYHDDPSTDSFWIETAQDVEPIIERNKESYNNQNHERWGDGRIVASIPLTVMLELARRGICTPAGHVLDQKAFKAFLNDPENRHFRTRDGRI